jgi:uncharacterized damage-inducible protein DinB
MGDNYTGSELEILHAMLDKNRDVMVWKLEGLTDEEMRRPMLPSGTNLLGMVKHLAAVEYGWFGLTFDIETEPLPFDENDADADLTVRDDESTQDILDFYARGRAFADNVISELSLDTTGKAWGSGPERSLRWIIAHMIEETARHAGHADAVRELIDGTTGYLPKN